MPSFFQTGCTGKSRVGGEFLSGCALAFGGCSKGQALPEEGHVLAPWVMIEFEGQNSIITVGNESSDNTPQKHTSVIKSFEFGHQDGMTVRVVIHDQQGGSFEQFMANLLKNWACMDRMKKTYRMKFQFGWVKSGCNIPFPAASSPIYYAVMDAVESNYAEGKFMFEITGKDMAVRMMEGSTSLTWGADGSGATSLKQALTALLTNSCPPNVASIKFLKMEGGQARPVNFFGNPDGPITKWEGLAQDKLHVARRWVNGTLTENKRGWVMEYNACKEGGEIIFWEDRQPQGKAHDDWNSTCIGTYVVNGGKSSPVIEFNPKIRWDFGTLVSEGGSASSLTAAPLPSGDGGVKSPGRREANSLTRANQPCAGKPLNMSEAPQHLTDDYGDEAQDKMHQAQAENLRAFKIEAFEEIQADLVIIGDPTLMPLAEGVATKNCTIVFINPYQILNSDSGKAEWLNTPPCNTVLSNKAWIVKYITHKIESGNYTTTLGVFLTAPGKHLDVGEPLGGWVGGWKPTNC